MDGIFGWLGDHAAHQELIKSMGRATRVSAEGLPHEHSNSMLGIAGYSRFGKAATHVEDSLAAALHGRPTFHDDTLAAIARDRGPPPPPHQAGHVLARSCRRSCPAPSRWQSSSRCASARSSPSIAWGSSACAMPAATDNCVFGTSARASAAHPAIGGSVDLQAIYDYLYFHAIPSPRTLYHGIEKLLPGQCLSLDNGEAPSRLLLACRLQPQSPVATSAAIAAHFASCCARW